MSPPTLGGDNFLTPASPSLLNRIATQLIDTLPVTLVLVYFNEEHFTDSVYDSYHLPLNQRLEKAAPKRRAEYLAARVCARSALNHSGINAIPWQEQGERCPIWPSPFIGSMTHSQGIASAAVANRNLLRGIGIDIERWIEPQRAQKLASSILTEEEMAHWHALDTPLQTKWLIRIFSAKESLYKAIYPLARRPFYFHDASTEFDPIDSSRFILHLNLNLDEHFKKGFSAQVRTLDYDEGVLTLIAFE